MNELTSRIEQTFRTFPVLDIGSENTKSRRDVFINSAQWAHLGFPGIGTPFLAIW
jgi:hypothetical protein